MGSRNTIRESSHLCLLWWGPFLWSSATASEHTWHVCLSDPQVSPFAWETSGSLPFAWVISGSMPSVQNYRPYIIFSSPMQIYEYPLHPRIFLFMDVYRNLHTSGIFPVNCWSFLRTKISVTLSISNTLYSNHNILYFSSQWKPLCWCYLATALNLLSSSSPAKQVNYTSPVA